MAKKVLFMSHVANFQKFNRPFMRWFTEQEWSVHYASAEEEAVYDCDAHFQVPFARSPWSKNNVLAYRQLKAIIDREHYDIIHTHTPVGSIVTRLAARDARKEGTKVIYTAHGFHFFQGAPLINWLIYYPAEKIMSRYTDCLVTINEEDYQNAKKKHFRAGSIKKIDGVGVNLKKFIPLEQEQRNTIRSELGFQEKDFLLICVAEFIKRKNQRFLIHSMNKLIRQIPNCKLLLVGKGDLLEECKQLCLDSSLENAVSFYGYREDVEKLCGAADVLVAASYQEGLAINIMEGMAVGLPVVCSNVRGQRDIIRDGVNGLIYETDDEDTFVAKIGILYGNQELRHKMSQDNINDVKKYSLDRAIENMADIYKEFM